MTVWQREYFEDYVNFRNFDVVDPGPLLAPISEFKIARNEKLELILETLVTGRADPMRMPSYPAGMVRINNDNVELAGHAGMRCTLHGIVPFSQNSSWKANGIEQTTERAKIHGLTASINNDIAGAYTIDWLENLDTSGIWIGSSVKDEQETVDMRIIGREDGFKLETSTNTRETVSSTALEMIIGGVRLFLCGSGKDFKNGYERPGYILYIDCPDGVTRKRVRDVLSFCLGNFLVYLGSTTLSSDAQIVGFRAVSPPRIGQITEADSQPPAPLGEKYQHEVNQQTLGRMANALYSHYDELEFESLSWAYWHARCAPVHMAAAHYGAALEALQSAYMKAHPTKFERVLIDDVLWKPLKQKLLAALADSGVAPDIREILANKVKSNLNQTPTGALWSKLFTETGIILGDAETTAWKRRNLAAHGGAVNDETAIPTIRETKLLKIILHRMILKIAGASDRYYDDYTIGHAVRNLADFVPS